MDKRFFIIIIFLLTLSIFGISQQIPLNNQYVINKTSLIPALSGYSGNIESFVTYRQSWIGIKGAPRLALFDINGALNEKMGLGFSFMTEKTGNFSQNYLFATYSYHQYFSKKLSLSAALSPMFFSNQIDFSTVRSFGTHLDPMLQNSDNLSASTFDIGISLALIAGNFNVGVSIPQTIGMTLKFNNSGSNFSLKRHYFAFVSYLYERGDWKFEPMATMRTTATSPFDYGINMMLKYKNKIWTNIGYNANTSVLISVGALSGNNLAISYSYEFGFSGIAAASMGTHEITLGFLIKPAKKFKKNATVFYPEQSKIQTDNNLTKKIASLDYGLKQEQQDRQNKEETMQKQIDSLKAVIAKGYIKTDTSQKTQHWLQRIVSQNITFGLMSDKMFSSSFSELDKYSKKLRMDRKLKIKILVYTDNLFSEEVNKKLSTNRAKSVANYLLSKPGIGKSQVEYEGMGSVDPIGDNTTPEGREKNNRVEFLFNKKIF